MKKYVVQTFSPNGRSSVAKFDSLAIAEKHRALNGGIIWHSSHIARIHDGAVYLHAKSAALSPLYSNSGE